MKLNDLQTKKQLFNHDQRLRKLEKASGQGNSGSSIVVVDTVEENNTNAVQSGAVYNHVAEQVGNIEILLSTI